MSTTEPPPTPDTVPTPGKASVHDSGDDDLSWMVHNRARVWYAMLNVYRVAGSNRARECTDKASQDSMLLLVGISFSLWRAVLLPHKDSITYEENRCYAEAYLRELIKTNNVNFSTDSKNNLWTFGFYLNNARQRLQGLLRDYGGCFNLKDALATIADTHLSVERTGSETSRETWLVYCKALESVTDIFIREWDLEKIAPNPLYT